MAMVAGDVKRRALGRGLESLLPARPAAGVVASMTAAAEAVPSGKPLEIAVDRVERNPFQTRTEFDEAQLKELAASIRAMGVIQPITVRPAAEGRYTLISGERRWRASQMAGRETIPAVVREVSDEQAMEMTIVENLQRADLNPMEQATAFHTLMQRFQMTQEQVAERTGKDRATVANFLRMLRLPEIVQMYVQQGYLSFGHARALLALPTPELVAMAAKKVLTLNLSVRSTEKYVQGLLMPAAEKADEPAKQPVDANVRHAQERLRHKLGLKVTIEDKNGRGRVVIEYAGVDDFDAILQALGE